MPAAAAAQAIERPRVEIGGSIGTLGTVASGHQLFTKGVRLTANVTDRTAVELITEVLLGEFSFDSPHGLYILQIKRVFREGGPSRSAVFVTAGVGGAFSYERASEYRFARPDGSVVVHPPRTHGALSRPVFVAGGVGFERVIARFVAVRGTPRRSMRRRLARRPSGRGSLPVSRSRSGATDGPVSDRPER
jgi:hypothetical protein